MYSCIESSVEWHTSGADCGAEVLFHLSRCSHTSSAYDDHHHTLLLLEGGLSRHHAYSFHPGTKL